MDCSDLGSIIRGGRMKINVSGLADGSENTTLYSADYAYDPDENLYVVCRNYSGTVSGLPAVSEAVQPVIASADRIFEVSDNAPMESADPVWALYNAKQRRIGAIHTAVDDDDDFFSFRAVISAFITGVSLLMNTDIPFHREVWIYISRPRPSAATKD